MKTAERTEKDSMGEMKIPEGCLYGASTQRAVQNFPISGMGVPLEIIHALAQLKASCAEVNRDKKVLPIRLAKAILEASNAVAYGKYDAHFVVDVFQTGSGTSTNMNFNEVVANVANLALGSKIGAHAPVHPNDHVNLGQSSNDIFPSAIHVALVLLVEKTLLPALAALEGALRDKSRVFKNTVKVGRTHLQDATPLTLGQEFSGYAAQIKKSQLRLRNVLPRLRELAIGGTAVGTGINTLPQFGKWVCARLSARLRTQFVEAENHFEAQATLDTCVELSAVLKSLAVSLSKIGSDIRLMASGPRCGLGEISLPAVQPGSSIMPGKINPVIIESLLQVCAEVVGNDVTVTWAGASGNFELNTMMPLIGYKLRQSCVLLSNAIQNFEKNTVRGIKAEKRIGEALQKSLMVVTALVPVVGYDKAAAIARNAFETNRDIKTVAEEMGISKKNLSKLLDPARMV